ncbi:MAG: polyribonucleotide nucleotidyltransferase, partial [Candidatus Paceibacterota bacterium]
MNVYSKTVRVGDKDLTFRVGMFSQQANASVVAQMGDTVVHATVVAGGETSLGYFPLSVEFVEKLYAGGRIKGSRWVKRDGRPTDEAILKGRLIDRTIRPLFPEGLKNEIQVVTTVLSADAVNDPDVIAMAAASAALSISNIPWQGPIAGIRVGYVKEEDKFLINPTYDERKTSALDLMVSGSSDAIVMVEAGANEVPEEVIIRAFEIAQKEIAQVVACIQEMVKEQGKEKFSFAAPVPNTEMLDLLRKNHAKKITEFVALEAVLKPTGMDAFV